MRAAHPPPTVLRQPSLEPRGQCQRPPLQCPRIPAPALTMPPPSLAVTERAPSRRHPETRTQP
ncbi:hypothetical protein chiPu_0031462, partial [Chiloscyllium punctatum]|nr:hypothetical protein [Chiloscyllium punctatum]